MAGRKESALTRATFLDDENLIHITKLDAAVGSKSQAIRKDDFVDSLNLSLSSGSRLISGGMVWTSGLIFESVNLVYEITGEQFAITDGTTVTLATADGSNPRIDLIYGDDLGALDKSTGTPAGSPAANTLPAHQFQLTLATVAAGASTPSGVSIRTVYTEDAGQSGEFDATESTSAARITLGNTSSPLTGTKDIKTVTPNNADLITLVHSTATTLTNLASLEFDIKVATDWANDYLILKLLDSSVEVGVVNINSAFLDITDITTTQRVNIFKSDFALVAGQTEFDKITIFHRVRGSSTLSYQLDEFYINEDSGQTEPTSILASEVQVDADVFSGSLSSSDDNVQTALETLDGITTNATHTGDVTGATALSLDKTAISGQSLVTAVGADHVIIIDAGDGNLKKALISDFASAGGDMAVATYDSATVSEQLVGLTATQTLTNKRLTTIELGHATDSTIARVSAGLLSIEGNNIITANITSSATVKGVVELATTAETTTGTDTARAVTPDGLEDKLYGTFSGSTISDNGTLKAGLQELETAVEAAGGTTNLSEGSTTNTTVDVDSSSGTNATLVSASTTRAGVLTKAKWDEIVVNNAKNTNVSTDLSMGTVNGTQFTINSSDGNNVNLPLADTNNWGIISDEIFDEIVVNNAKNTNVSTDLSMGTVDGTQYIINSSDGNNVSLPLADTNNWGIISDEIFDEIVVNNAKVGFLNLTGHITSTGAAAVLGSFTVAQLSTALSDASISGNNTGDEVQGTTSVQGKLELATVAEVKTGTSTALAVTPEGVNKRNESLGFAASDETTDLEVADDVLNITMPNYATTLSGISASVITAPTGSNAIFDVEEAGTTILSTLITIAKGTKTSEDSPTAATGSVTLDTGGSGSVDGILVNSIEIMSGSESFDSSLATTATNVAANITANTSSPDYNASATDETITITAVATGSSVNGFTVVTSVTTITKTDVNMANGSDAPVISDTAIAANAILSFNIDSVGSTVAGTGLKFWIYFNRA